MAHIVQCRLCHIKFDTEKENFKLVGKKSYYHEKCYDEWIKTRNVAATNGDELFWKESVVDFLYRDVHMIINFAKLENQWESYIKPNKKMTPKGIYFALRYHFEIQHGDKEQAQGGIGIVPYVYSQAAQYWTALENRKSGTIEAIMQQIAERQARPVVHYTAPTNKKDKARWSLDAI